VKKRLLSVAQFILMLPLMFMFAAIKVKPLTDVADKWAEVTPMRASHYEKGAAEAADDWEKNAAAAGGAFKAAVSSATIQKMYEGGIKKAGSEKYKRKVTEVGKDRFGPGVTAAKPDFSENVAPYLDTIAAVTLSPRAPRGSETNYSRVKEVGAALHKKRLALRAAGS
jgi:hypothetical protein